ncbi:MAG: hypothetical protein AAFU85_23105 [Planctomycetota bacterium]
MKSVEPLEGALSQLLVAFDQRLSERLPVRRRKEDEGQEKEQTESHIKAQHGRAVDWMRLT